MKTKTYFFAVTLTPFICQSIDLKTLWKNPFIQPYQEVTTREYPCKEDATLTIEHEIGNITITSWKQPKMIVEASKTGPEEVVKQTKIHVTQQDDIIRLHTLKIDGVAIDYHILVPESVVLSSVSTQNGSIKVKHMKGPMTVSTEQGTIEVINAEKTVIARNAQGNVIIRQTHLAAPSAIIIDVTSGNVELSLASGINADLNLQTTKGSITSDQPVTLNETSIKLDRWSWEHLSKNVQAKLGTGGAPITVKISQRGDIALTEY